MIKKLVVVVLACIQPAIAVARPVIIPAKFHGEFNAAQKFCGTGLSDMRLRISATKIRFYESEGAVKSILFQPNGAITVMAEYSGEGETWTDMDQFSLSKDGNQLIVQNPSSEQTPQQSTTRIRCLKR
jgi:hypothetical protein